MSREMRRKETWEWETVSLTCSICGYTTDDPVEMAEFLEIVKEYGYASEHFGDMTIVNFEICEACTHRMLGHITEGIRLYVPPTMWFEEPEEEDLTIETADGTITIRR